MIDAYWRRFDLRRAVDGDYDRAGNYTTRLAAAAPDLAQALLDAWAENERLRTQGVWVPLPMANELRQMVEALSLSENWSPNGAGTKVLRDLRAILEGEVET